MTQKPLMTVTEAAALMGVSRNTAYRLARAGQLPGLVRREGFRDVVRRAVTEAWMEGR